MIAQFQDITRLLPQAVDAEQGLLCSFMLDPDYAGGICDAKAVTALHFHIPANEITFRVLKGLYDERKKADFINVTQILRDRGQIDQVGGAAFITGLFTYIPTAANADYYADAVIEKHTLREVIRVCTRFAGEAYEPQESAERLLDALEGEVMGIRKGDDSELKEIDPQAGAMGAINDLEKLYESRGAITGLATGFSELDRMTDGFQPANFVVIAARPSMGKTALGMNMAEHMALHAGKAVAVFSAEMAGRQLHKRLICSVARIDAQRARDGFMGDKDFSELQKAAQKIANSKLYVVDAQGASIGAIRAKARRLHRKHNLAAIFVDFLQCLKSKSAQARNNREREIAEISQGLKNLAKELNIPVVALAQLNRDVDKRTGSAKGRPMLSDLRESGSIEQDADVVGLLMRDEYYAIGEAKKECEGQATLIIAKQRNGPVGDIPLTFLKEFARFESRAREVEEEPRVYND